MDYVSEDELTCEHSTAGHSRVHSKLATQRQENRFMTTLPVDTSTTSGAPTTDFIDRRGSKDNSKGIERRQFGNSHSMLSAEARELAEAIDAYKLQHRRRYITYEEMLQVIQSLGYQKN
jgi:hypothetical protein